MQITMLDAKELTLDVLKAGLVPSLISSPGIGKSALAREIAEDNQLEFIDIRLSQMDPSDLNGFPFLDRDSKIKRAQYVPMNIFPVEGDPLPEGKKGWLVLMDEMNSATPALQVAAYKIVLDRMVGMHKLHAKCAVMTAGNLTTDKAIVNRVGTAMQSRLIWLEIIVSTKAFRMYADRVGLDHRVKAYIDFQPDDLHNFDPNHNEHTFACPRTWEFVSRLITFFKDVTIKKLPLLAGTVGEGMARKFYSFTKIYKEIPTIEEIKANPMGTTLGSEPSIQYALSGLIGHHMDTSNSAALMKFLTRMAIEFQVIALRTAIARDTRIMQAKGVHEWVVHNAKELK